MKRSARIVDMTYQLVTSPYQLFSLSYFSQKYSAAKSSISEDLSIVKEVLESQEAGVLHTVTGAAGGVMFAPGMGKVQQKALILDMCKRLSQPDRLLPGGYLYMSDILGDQALVFAVGRMLASHFSNAGAEVMMTIETKGIPLAYAVAHYLGIPVVIVRRDSRVTEGSYVSINYISGSSRRVRTMSLARRSLEEGRRVLLIDDFMKAGGTLNGMIELLKEFHAKLTGIAVLVESQMPSFRLVSQYVSVMRLTEVNEAGYEVRVEPGNIIEASTLSKHQMNDE